MAKSSKTSKKNPTVGREIERVNLSNLLLDPENPRFGMQEKSTNQTTILDHIVDQFGVNDVLSSLAVNGYFEAEPVICRREKGSDTLVVIEGNRRLAACLILAGDKRASNQTIKAKEFHKIWKKNGFPKIDPIPVIAFDESEQQGAVLSYLGVRHIASSQPWDSYAKAAWVAKVVEESSLSISDVSQMIGDRHKTVNRLLEGFYLISQLIEKGQFVPADSVRRGRGSVTDYPFSWVYTTLGYANIRTFLSLTDSEAKKIPWQKMNCQKGEYF